MFQERMTTIGTVSGADIAKIFRAVDGVRHDYESSSVVRDLSGRMVISALRMSSNRWHVIVRNDVMSDVRSVFQDLTPMAPSGTANLTTKEDLYFQLVKNSDC